jgi:hypothetical protein
MGRDSQEKIKWHPAFYAAAELELKENIEELEFEREHNLSKEPIRMDLLILKNNAVIIKNEIGRIMRKYNIIEYKSPGDGMSIDDFAKTLGYAFLYKGYSETVNKIPMEELTVSMFRAANPRKLFAELKKEGHKIEEKYPGIYYVTNNLLFPVQIVVTQELNPETHSSLRILTDQAKAADISRFLEQARKLERPVDRDNIDAVLQASVAANFELYEKIRRNSVMCQAMRELMKDEINEERREARREGRQEGRQEGILETLLSLAKDDLISITEAANRAGMSESSFAEYMNK